MATAAQISVSEYLNTTYRPDRDYVDGVVLERNLGEYEHSRLQTRLVAYVFIREQEWKIRAVTEQRVQVKPTRFRIPDVCVLLAGDAVEPIFRNPPFLCIEIQSKDDSLTSTVYRLDDYLAMGVANVWVIDPRLRRGYRYTVEGFLEAKDGVLRTSSPELAVPLSALFD